MNVLRSVDSGDASNSGDYLALPKVSGLRKIPEPDQPDVIVDTIVLKKRELAVECGNL